MAQDNKDTVIYQSDTGAILLRSDETSGTIWATQKQIAQLFHVERTVVTKHLKNVFSSEELEENVVCAIFAHTTPHGAIADKTQTQDIKFYNLDALISVGYRINSKQATNFRKWATSVLKDHITQGYTLNQDFLKNRQADAQKAIETIRLLSQDSELITKNNVLDLIEGFTQTWFSLQAYDTDNLPKTGELSGEIEVSVQDLYAQIQILKQTLMTQGEATPLFAQEKQQGALEGILGNVMQNVFGQDMYPTIEEKAAHLLYFIIKNHPFNDGNKRTGAFSFIWFLQQSNFPLMDYVTPNMLTALTLFIAESEPKYKHRIIGLILELLRSHKA